jgi:hypothetical protein
MVFCTKFGMFVAFLKNKIVFHGGSAVPLIPSPCFFFQYFYSCCCFPGITLNLSSTIAVTKFVIVKNVKGRFIHTLQARYLLAKLLFPGS